MLLKSIDAQEAELVPRCQDPKKIENGKKYFNILLCNLLVIVVFQQAWLTQTTTRWIGKHNNIRACSNNTQHLQSNTHAMHVAVYHWILSVWLAWVRIRIKKWLVFCQHWLISHSTVEYLTNFCSPLQGNKKWFAIKQHLGWLHECWSCRAYLLEGRSLELVNP